MKIDSVLSQAITGIQRGLSSARDNAATIASADSFSNGSSDKLVEAMVGLKLDKLQVQASTEVLKAADEMIGTLFDDKT
ncbi:hypothetical protein MNBD_GAMMA15-494 [hydrothermal vent metagenome]|uniref:Flagellar biosynthesis protein FlgE n=1 Tax=hydrothermal vent metagenome TaxID=652676 RepID=A0A3B0YM81_9ZZZZ